MKSRLLFAVAVVVGTGLALVGPARAATFGPAHAGGHTVRSANWADHAGASLGA